MATKTSEAEILNVYARHQSIKAVVKECGCSFHRVRKVLASNGIIINESHAHIIELYNSGASIQEIAKAVGLAEATVKSYLPRVRSEYFSPTANALRIRKCRAKKKASE